MENIIYNELLIRGFNVDVGVVEHSERDENGKVVRRDWKWILSATVAIRDIIFSLPLRFRTAAKCSRSRSHWCI